MTTTLSFGTPPSPGDNAAGYEDDYAPNYSPGTRATTDVIVMKGADNPGTFLTGLDATGYSAGEKRYILNLGAHGYRGIDAGQVMIIDESHGVALTASPLTVTPDHTTDKFSATAHGRKTGDGPFSLTSTVSLPSSPVSADEPGGTPAATSFDNVWLIRTGANDFQLAQSLYTALAGIPITFSSNGSGTIQLVPQIHTTTLLSQRSSNGNRFRCPGGKNYQLPTFGMVGIMRDPDNAFWIVSDESNGDQKLTMTALLELYGNLVSGTPGAPMSGTYDDWNPVHDYTPDGFAYPTHDLEFRSHTAIRCHVDEDGATITGMIARSQQVLRPRDFGPMKLVVNHGPGKLTIKHLDAGSKAECRIYCPNDRDLVIQPNSAAWFWNPYPCQPNVYGQWRCISFGDTFENLVVNDTLELKALSFNAFAVTATLDAIGTPNYVDPGADDGAILNIEANANGSTLNGLAAKAVSGMVEVKIIANVGNGPLILINEDAGADPADRIETPGDGAPYIVGVRCQLMVVWNPDVNRWKPVANPVQDIRITPAVMANGNLSQWNPVDATTSLSWLHGARWIRAQGGTGTVLQSMVSGAKDGMEFVITNYGNTFTIQDNAGASGANFRTQAGNISVPLFGSVRIKYDQSNNIYLVVGRS